MILCAKCAILQCKLGNSLFPWKVSCFECRFWPRFAKIRFVNHWLSPELKMPRLDLLDIVVILSRLQSSDHGVKGEELLGDVDVLHHHKSWLAWAKMIQLASRQCFWRKLSQNYMEKKKSFLILILRNMDLPFARLYPFQIQKFWNVKIYFISHYYEP